MLYQEVRGYTIHVLYEPFNCDGSSIAKESVETWQSDVPGRM